MRRRLNFLQIAGVLPLSVEHGPHNRARNPRGQIGRTQSSVTQTISRLLSLFFVETNPRQQFGFESRVMHLRSVAIHDILGQPFKFSALAPPGRNINSIFLNRLLQNGIQYGSGNFSAIVNQAIGLALANAVKQLALFRCNYEIGRASCRERV